MNIYILTEITNLYYNPVQYIKSKIPVYNTINYIYDKSKIYYNEYNRQQKLNKIYPIEMKNLKLIDHV